MTPSADVTQLLSAAGRGDAGALDAIYPLVYDELRRLAHSARSQSPHRTLNTTALVHEAYLKLAGSEAAWTDRKHFYALAAKVMRQVVLNYARSQRAEKRGGAAQRLDLQDVLAHDLATQAFSGSPLAPERADALVALDEALEEIARQHQRLASVIELRFYGGFTIPETAALLDVSPATARRDWTLGRAWLYQRVKALTA